MTRVSASARQESIDVLRELCPPGTEVQILCRHVSRSGMMRLLTPIVQTDTGPMYLAWHVSRAVGFTYSEKTGHASCRVDGCGMDMGFHLVYSLARTLWQHDLDNIDPILTNDGTDAGYCLRYRWL